MKVQFGEVGRRQKKFGEKGLSPSIMPSYNWLLFEIKEKSIQTINELKEFCIKINPSGRKSYYRTHLEFVSEFKKLLNTHIGEAF